MIILEEPVATDHPEFNFYSKLLAYGNDYAAFRPFAEYDDVFGDELSVPIIYAP